ncbi:hypothetical protein F4818DRAFT_435569 [Hypoxylon cercidicola]|nr:hypothetical protein F4818DRAFT_435569 [Hypoxylon cercidicola]
MSQGTTQLEMISGDPVRILVRTATHLVPGEDFSQRCFFLLNRICQHHWNRDFDHIQDRWNAHGAWFGYDNRRCYFLVDHGQSLHDEHVPVLWYEWTGEFLCGHSQTTTAETSC